MRWDDLFDELESQLDFERHEEDRALEAEEERLRIGWLGMRDRIVAIAPAGAPGVVRVVLRGGRDLVIRPKTVGRDWVAADLVRAHGREGACILPFAAITQLVLRPDEVASTLAPAERTAAPRVTDRIPFSFVLRDLCRRRSYVTLSGIGFSMGGTIDRVGKDHADVAVHEAGSPRRSDEVSEVRVVALGSVDVLEI